VGRFTPYLRGQVFLTDGPSDPFFVPDDSTPNTFWVDEIDGIAGLRFDLTAWTSLRAEYRFTHPTGMDDVHEGVLQWAWGF
jgi:hypothetical protein